MKPGSATVMLVLAAGLLACGAETTRPPSDRCKQSAPGGSWRNEATGDVLTFVGGNPTIAHAGGGKTALFARPFDGRPPVTCGWRSGPRRFDSLQPVQDGFRIILRADAGAAFAGVPTSIAAGKVSGGRGISIGQPTPLSSEVQISEMGMTLTATVMIGRTSLAADRGDVTWSLRWQMRNQGGETVNDGLEIEARFGCTSRCVLNLAPHTEACIR